MHALLAPLRSALLAVVLAGLAAAGAACTAREDGGGAAAPLQTERYLVGAYYYTWYPRNFDQGYLRRKLIPPQVPQLGKYRSADPGTAEQHISWASRHGVDFFAISWWPGREQNTVIPAAFLRAGNIGDIRFCIFYESWALGFDKGRGMTIFTKEKADRFVADMISFAEDYFRHPSYLRVGGRPVVFLYLTRTFTGEYEEAIARARRELAARGFDPFFVADEIFWQVSPVGNATAGPALTTDPQRARIRLFDAITAYNLYENTKPGQRGYTAWSSFVPDALDLYRDYRAAAGGGVYVVPGIIPGYNDRGVRLSTRHYAIPRRWEPDAPEGSTLARLFDRLAFPLVDSRLNMMMITTWNEWNEDTAIEPLDPAPPTSRDASPSGRDYTQGYAYSGHGMLPLEAVRDKVVAVAGRLTDAAGAPRGGVEVVASRDGSEAARGTSDGDGYYRLSRLHLRPGAYVVTAPGVEQSRPVEVRAGETATGVDLVLPPPAGR